MGNSHYSDVKYTSRIDHHKTTGTSYFKTDTLVDTGQKLVVDEMLDPSKLNKAGFNIRESVDSDSHPTSKAIAIFFDVTGSMRNVPKLFVEKLGKMMTLLTNQKIVTDPHILFGAIGDAVCDQVPLQIGQFEAGNEMDEWLSRVVREGQGGGQSTESYELAMFYMARHSYLDCHEKRGQKGYLFLMGDETPYPKVSKTQAKKLIGDQAKIDEDIPLAVILKELRQKFEVFWILPSNTDHAHDSTVIGVLQHLFGQNLLLLENPENVCELVASTIGLYEGKQIVDIEDFLKQAGTSEDTIKDTISTLANIIV